MSNNDGIIIALNQEAKNLGLKRGDAYFQVKAFCKMKEVYVFSSNYTLYADICTRLNLIYASFAPEIEIYSIDESFLYFPNWKNADFISMARELKEKVWQEVHIPIAIGIAPTKTLAKLCNKLAKTRAGVCFWDTIDQKAELEKLNAGAIWSIGRAREKELLRIMYREGYEYRKVMINLMGLEEEKESQLLLFIDENEAENGNKISECKKEALMAVCDALADRYGKSCLHPGLRNAVKDKTNDGKAASWKMKRNMLSPSYTTRIEEVPKVF